MGETFSFNCWAIEIEVPSNHQSSDLSVIRINRVLAALVNLSKRQWLRINHFANSKQKEREREEESKKGQQLRLSRII